MKLAHEFWSLFGRSLNVVDYSANFNLILILILIPITNKQYFTLTVFYHFYRHHVVCLEKAQTKE